MTTTQEPITCHSCGCIIETDDTYEYNGNTYCEECFHEEFSVCDHCGEIVPYDSLVSVDDGAKYVCEDCADSHYTLCDHCHNYYSDRNIWGADDHRTICNNCSEDYYLCCECGEILHYNDTNWHNDQPYCEYCMPEESEYIHYYSYQPDWQKLRTDADSMGCRLYGVELEIDKGNDANACSEALHDLSDHFIMKHDGSLTDDGIEIVTHPASLAFHLEKMGWDEITKTAREYEYLSHDANTCGLHIHIGRQQLHTDTAEKLVVLVDRLWSQLVTFSRREYRQLEQWARKPEAEINGTDPEEIRKDKLHKVMCKGRYQAVNLQNSSTIEIRIFRGTLKTNTIYATLQLVDCLCAYCEAHSVADCANAKWGDITALSNAPELAEYLRERGLR